MWAKFTNKYTGKPCYIRKDRIIGWYPLREWYPEPEDYTCIDVGQPSVYHVTESPEQIAEALNVG